MRLSTANALQEELAFIWVLLITTVVATFFIEHYKITAIPPSGAAMALGMVFGGIGRLAGMHEAQLLHAYGTYDTASLEASNTHCRNSRLLCGLVLGGIHRACSAASCTHT